MEFAEFPRLFTPGARATSCVKLRLFTDCAEFQREAQIHALPYREHDLLGHIAEAFLLCRYYILARRQRQRVIFSGRRGCHLSGDIGVHAADFDRSTGNGRLGLIQDNSNDGTHFELGIRSGGHQEYSQEQDWSLSHTTPLQTQIRILRPSCAKYALSSEQYTTATELVNDSTV